MGFHHVGLAGLELLTLSDPLTPASQSAGITGVSHCTSYVLYYEHLPDPPNLQTNNEAHGKPETGACLLDDVWIPLNRR